MLRSLTLALVLTACTAPVSGTPSPEAPASPIPESDAASPVTRHAFPASIDPAARFMFYLHGKIIEDAGLPAVSPEFGEYDYLGILEVLEGHGFVVISEQRPKDTDAEAYARRVVGQVHALINAGVPSGNITVVGASKGGAIAAMASGLLQDPGLNYVLLGSCHPDTVAAWQGAGLVLHGNVLAIRDAADVQYAGSCEALFQTSEGKGLGRHQEIVLDVGTGHGILYGPLADWVLPTVEWAGK